MAALIGACTDPTQSLSLDGLSPPPRSENDGASAPTSTRWRPPTKPTRPTPRQPSPTPRRCGRPAPRRTRWRCSTPRPGPSPTDRRLALERGLLALELGETANAETLLRAAHDPRLPTGGCIRRSARRSPPAASRRKPRLQFAKALALAPDHPSILNNLALSYALDGKTGEAEKLLRRAAARHGWHRPRRGKVQQNLALVLGLGGKFAEARTVAEAALPADKASENVAYLQKLAEARAAAADRKEAAAESAATGLPAGRAT